MAAELHSRNLWLSDRTTSNKLTNKLLMSVQEVSNARAAIAHHH